MAENRIYWDGRQYTPSELIEGVKWGDFRSKEEASFRRGYHHGFLAAVDAIYGDQPLPPELAHFIANDLPDWRRRGNPVGRKREAPPVAPQIS